jgi:hypothetical protein
MTISFEAVNLVEEMDEYINEEYRRELAELMQEELEYWDGGDEVFAYTIEDPEYL